MSRYTQHSLIRARIATLLGRIYDADDRLVNQIFTLAYTQGVHDATRALQARAERVIDDIYGELRDEIGGFPNE